MVASSRTATASANPEQFRQTGHPRIVNAAKPAWGAVDPDLRRPKAELVEQLAQEGMLFGRNTMSW